MAWKAQKEFQDAESVNIQRDGLYGMMLETQTPELERPSREFERLDSMLMVKRIL